MKVRQLDDFAFAEDIQIQTATHLIGLQATFNADIYDTVNYPVEIELRHVASHTGTTHILDRMLLCDALEHNTFGEGFFRYDKQASGQYFLQASILVGEGGALDLQGGYLSLSIFANSLKIAGMQVYATDHYKLVNTFRRINPVTINGSTKDVKTVGVKTIALPVNRVRNLTLFGQDRPVVLDNFEVILQTYAQNDIVSADFENGKSTHGFRRQLLMPVENIRSVKIDPISQTQQFQVYLHQTQVLGTFDQ